MIHVAAHFVTQACCCPAGGEDAMSVTQSAGKVGKFDAVFWHMIFEEEMGKVKGHFVSRHLPHVVLPPLIRIQIASVKMLTF